VTLHNFAGLMACCAVFLVLTFLNPWYAVSFVCAVIGFVLLAFCYGAFHLARHNKHCDACDLWYKR